MTSTPLSETNQNYQIGEWVEGEGVYLGTYDFQKVVRTGKSGFNLPGTFDPIDPKYILNETFNVFAAPEDVTIPRNLNLDVISKKVGELVNWHGHNGGYYKNAEEIYASLAKGSYSGEWVVPPREIVGSSLIDYGVEDTLYAHRNTGHFKNSFAASSQKKISDAYIASTADTSNTFWFVKFSSGEGHRYCSWNDFNHKFDKGGLHCRPVRFVKAGPSQK